MIFLFFQNVFFKSILIYIMLTTILYPIYKRKSQLKQNNPLNRLIFSPSLKKEPHTKYTLISPIYKKILFFDWTRQGDPSEHIYIVLTGRLRSVITKENGKKELVGEYGRGELVGIVEVLTEAKRTTTIMAIR